MEKHSCDIVVLGAGAAGLMAAYQCALSDKEVILIDHNQKIGRKILISGGGRCNFTNIYSSPDDFVSNNKHFCKSALSRYTPYDFLELVNDANVNYFEKKLGQLFCRNSAKDIIELLFKNIQRPNVVIKLSQKNLKVSFDQSFEIYNEDVLYSTKKLIVATGGLSLPSIGASDLGYQIARQFGHEIVKPFPSLVPFILHKQFSLPGTSLIAKVTCGTNTITEDILFTHKGLSGPGILKISLYWSEGQALVFDWLPTHNVSKLIEDAPKSKSLTQLFKALLPKKFVIKFLEMINLSPLTNLGDLSKEQVLILESNLHRMAITPKTTEGFRKAEVTRGGVDTKDISSKTMESKLQDGLYFIGEVLDVTGQLGGHNFQWAWSSAFAAGNSAKECTKD